MRMLFVSGALYGHVNTMLPLAGAALNAGHDVVVATGPDLVAHVQRHGFEAWGVGLRHAEAGGSRQVSWLAYFEATAQKRLADLVPRALRWQPDWVVHEETALCGPVLAALCGAAHGVHGLGVMPPPQVWGPFAQAVDRLASAWHIASISRAVREATYLHVCPPSLALAGDAIWRNVQPLRHSAGLPTESDALPPALDALPYRDTIHLTLGTVFNEAVDVLDAAIRGIRPLPFNLVVTAGPGVDPHRFGPQPEHVLIAPYLPHTLLLPRCRAVVSQGGAGIMIGALAHGLPQLVLPQGGDQAMNAEACVRSGAGLALAPAQVSPRAITQAVQRLLAEPSITLAARAISAEVREMPGADTVLEHMVGRRTDAFEREAASVAATELRVRSGHGRDASGALCYPQQSQ
jgi:UDP:flavonoid glycosyltransferase YjiC (YdhE family)